MTDGRQNLPYSNFQKKSNKQSFNSVEKKT
jgi:hypothetical protein